jgi:SAM-dependent methyltransferase
MTPAQKLSFEAPPQERYLFKPSVGSSHSWALGQLTGSVHGRRVLDIGAGGGGIGARLKPEAPAQLVAVEIDLRAHPLLTPIYSEVHTTLEPLAGRQFDTVVLLDVLEHLAEPEAFIRTLHPLLAPGATLLISVPNVAHWSVRLPLFLWGSFEYQPRGLLDRTHLQLFTRKRLTQLCRCIPGAQLEQLAASIEPVELLLPSWAHQNPIFRGLAHIRRAVATTVPGLMAYQLLARVRCA